MQTRFFKIMSLFLVLLLLVNMLPMSVFAEEFQKGLQKAEAGDTASLSNEEAYIVEEVLEKRTEYSKEFLLSNGLHIATVYGDAVHYETDNGWEEIDNTLQANRDGTLSNTAGVWDVRLPGQLSTDSPITVEKDGYTLSFRLTGELEAGKAELTRSLGTVETESFALSQTKTAKAEIRQVDLSAMTESVEYPEMVPQKNQSRVAYTGVYENTDILYDLEANRVKESVILKSYSPDLRGYQYTLEVGTMLPVLEESGQITFYDPQRKNVVMVMPAPFLVDDAGVRSDDVRVTLTGSGSSYSLTYLLPQQWLAAEDRAWPVVLDPAVTPAITTSNILDQTITENSDLDYMSKDLVVGVDPDHGICRTVIKFDELPALTSSDVIVGAEIQMCASGGGTSDIVMVEVHAVENDWTSSDVTRLSDVTFNEVIEDYAYVGKYSVSGWVVTDIVRNWYEDRNTGMLFKVENAYEESTSEQFYELIKFYASDSTQYSNTKPVLIITFRNNNGLESYWDYTTASAGRAGSGAVNNFTGNMTWVRSDLGFGGNRMPVTVQHIYNLNDAIVPSDTNNSNDTGGNTFGMGLGWRTNYNELLYRWVLDGTEKEYYIWEDSDGTDHYFKNENGTYKDEDGLEMTLEVKTSGDYKYVITDKQGYARYFDTYGRLVKLENNQEIKSSITVAYTTPTGKQIYSVEDGVGREYRFEYENGLCSRIGYYGSGETEITYVRFTYSGNRLIRVTDKDEGVSNYAYSDKGLLVEAEDVDGYKLRYSYNDVSADTPWQPYRVQSVTESYNSTEGGKLTFAYGHNQTTVTDQNGNVQIMQFNDFGNTECIQDSEGRAQFCQYALRTDKQKEDNTDPTVKGNQLRVASDLQYTTASLLLDGNMALNEYSFGDIWEIYGVAGVEFSNYCYADSYLLSISPLNEDESGGIISIPFTVAPGQTQTFSCYVKPRTTSVFLMAQCDGETKVSETEPAEYKWQRMQISYTNESDEPKEVRYCVMGTAAGNFFMDCAQVENAPIASRYNLISNGDFNFGESRWTRVNLGGGDGVVALTESAAPQLDSNVLKITGNSVLEQGLKQRVKIYGQEGDSLVLSGWAKGNAVPSRTVNDQERKFALQCTIHYGTNDEETFTAQFNTDSDQWQYGAVAIQAKKAYSYVTVRLAYDYNVNTVYFDGIQLNKDEAANTFTYDEDGNVVSAVNAAGERTNYEYTQNDLTKEILPGDVELTYEYDEYHNVKKATTQEGLEYSFTYDDYGNNTQVSVTGNDKTMSSSAVYTTDGNRLVSTTDALGKTTTYSYNAETNLLDWMQAPGETEATRTVYTYDPDNYLLEKVTKGNGEEVTDTLSVQYAYENDRLDTITSPTTTYDFAYGEFGLRTGVSAGGQTLASYIYSDDGNNYLEKLAYGNNDVVEYTRDDQGRVTEAAYGKADETARETVTYTYDTSGSLATVYDSASGITASYAYDLSDRLHKYLETGDGHSVMLRYNYDEENRLSTVRESINGWSRLSRYTYDDDNRLTKFQKAYGIRSYTYDDFNRVKETTTKDHDTQVLKTEYRFNDTETTVSGQVKEVAHTYAPSTDPDVEETPDLTYSYTYDDKGNILSISDGTNTTSYEYDSASQLIRENNQAENFTHVWAYDNAGNILSRKEYAYTTDKTGELGTPTDTVLYGYSTDGWGDLLTSYDGRQVVSDEIGNITDDGNRTYTWKNGRELDTVTDDGTTWSMTYNADGLRTKRTDGSTTYSYVYDGGTLLRMKKGSEHMMFAHSPDGVPLSIVYDDLLYYYVTNIQGDVVAILDATGAEVVTYTYDAWGNIRTMGGSKATTLGQDNPLRYRGYVYDQETGLYYLQSRYYDPEIGRFINADSQLNPQDGMLGFNMLAYCHNNPVMYSDQAGHSIILACVIIGAAFGAVVGGFAGAQVSKATTGEVKGWAVVAGAVGGGIVGGLAGWGVGLLITPVGTAASGTVGGTVAYAGYEVYKNWQSAEQGLRQTINSVSDYASRVMQTPYGERVVDAYNKTTKVIAEAKYGYQALSSFIQTEIQRDAWLLQSGAVKEVQWHFYFSQVSGTIGGSYRLIHELLVNGIQVFYH